MVEAGAFEQVNSVGNASRQRGRAGERIASIRPNPEVSADRQIGEPRRQLRYGPTLT